MTYLQLGQLILSLDRADLPKDVTPYGYLKSWGVPEGSINNGRLAGRFFASFVRPGLISEERAEKILTARIARQTHRLLCGKSGSGIQMTPETLSDVLHGDNPAAIGAELDSLARHGLTVTEKSQADALFHALIFNWIRAFLAFFHPEPA